MSSFVKGKHNYICKVISFLLVFSLIFSSIAPSLSFAQAISLPAPGTFITASPTYVPTFLKGMTIHPEDPFKFDFIIDNGHSKVQGEDLKSESKRLINYFLASLTVPQGDLWVNLSPGEKDRIVPDELGSTELGRDLLAQDYILKQLTASLMHPEGKSGKKFWDKIYKQAQDKFGTTDISTDTFNKVWILPDTATIYEHGTTVYVVESKMKVMLDSDRMIGNNKESLNSQLIKEIILPAIEKEVNQGENFALLRQIYHSLILAKWYKQKVKNSIISKVYIDKNKVEGINLSSPTAKEDIYNQYMDAYKKGVYSYIKEEYDFTSQQIIPKKYFSGGFKDKAMTVSRTDDISKIQLAKVGSEFVESVQLNPQGSDEAMMSRGTNWHIRQLDNIDKNIRLNSLKELVARYKSKSKQRQKIEEAFLNNLDHPRDGIRLETRGILQKLDVSKKILAKRYASILLNSKDSAPNLSKWFKEVDKPTYKIDFYELRKLKFNGILDVNRKNFSLDRLELFKKYKKGILNILFRVLNDLLDENYQVDGRQVNYASYVTDNASHAVNDVIENLASALKAAGEIEIFEEILQRIVKLPYSKNVRKQKHLFNLILAIVPMDITLSQDLLAWTSKNILEKGYFILETDEHYTRKLIHLINQIEGKRDYYLVRLLARLMLKDVSGQVNVGADHPLRRRTRQGSYGIGIYGFIRDNIHNFLGIQCVGLLERYLEYLLTQDPKVLIDEDYQVDYFKGEKNYVKGLYPKSVYDMRIERIPDGAVHYEAEKGYAKQLKELLGSLPKSLGETKYERLRNASEEQIAEILGEEYITEQTVSFGGYIYAYRELSRRFNRGELNNHIKRFDRYIEEIYYKFSNKIDLGEVDQISSRILTGDYIGALSLITDIKLEVKDLLFSDDVKYNPEELDDRFREEEGRDDTGNATGGAKFRDDRFYLYKLEQLLSLLEAEILPQIISKNFTRIDKNNINGAVSFLRELIESNYTNGSVPISFIDYVDSMQRNDITLEELKDLVLYLKNKLDNIVDKLEGHLPELVQLFSMEEKKFNVENYDHSLSFLFKFINKLVGYVDNRWQESLSDGKDTSKELFYDEVILDKENARPYHLVGKYLDKGYLKETISNVGRYLLGAKAIGLVRSALLSLNVPPAVVFPLDMEEVDVDNIFKGENSVFDLALGDLHKYIGENEGNIFKGKYGDMKEPMLVSVRSGAYFTLPGQLPTITNVGLNQKNIGGLIDMFIASGLSKEDASWTAWDCYRKLVKGFAVDVLSLNSKSFDVILYNMKNEFNINVKYKLTADQMKQVALAYHKYVEDKAGKNSIPEDLDEQIELVVKAVHKGQEKAVGYLKSINLSERWKRSAIIIQPMVFGNTRDGAGAAVLQTRRGNLFEWNMTGDYKASSQGDDIAIGNAAAITDFKKIIESKEWRDKFVDQMQELDDYLATDTEVELTVTADTFFILQARDASSEAKLKTFPVVPNNGNSIIKQGEAIGASEGGYRGRVIAIKGHEFNEDIRNKIIEEYKKSKEDELVDGLVLVTDSLGADETISFIEQTKTEDGKQMIGAIIMQKGARTSHAVDILKESGIVAVISVRNNMQFIEGGAILLKNEAIDSNSIVSVDGTRGIISKGITPMSAAEFLKGINLNITEDDFVEKFTRTEMMNEIKDILGVLVKENSSVAVDRYEQIADIEILSQLLKVKDSLPEILLKLVESYHINDKAMVSSVGGINMNSIELDARGSEGEIIFDANAFDSIKGVDIKGFLPVIINIIPINSVLPLLGLDIEEKEEEQEVALQLSRAVIKEDIYFL
ncbi:MAG: PEP-utilizing enzyme [Candidatus Zapsychrus exili]|nr:PEP-utilizing enzyme [Candidatus Zapsychrus exili]